MTGYRRLALLLVTIISTATQAQFRFTSHLRAAGLYARGPNSWLAGDFGRMDRGGRGEDGHRSIALGIADIGLDWNPSPHFGLHVHGLAREEPSDYSGTKGGLVEAFAELHAGSVTNEWQLRAGQFFLPTSRENRDELWSSPYTITFSALNTWIGHEFRPLGADLQWRHTTAGGVAVTLGGTAFQGNDSMGALLAWNGWGIGNRLSVWNEVVPLVPLFSFGDSRMFASQRDGSRPFGQDLDGRTGWSGRARIRFADHGLVQFTRVDNRGDRGLYRGEYAWATQFDMLAAELGDPESRVLIAEFARGRTGMGERSGAHVDADLETFYVLTSIKRGRQRWSLRYDDFALRERDDSIAENNAEVGRAWTLAWFYDMTPSLRAGMEFADITGDRPAAAQSGRNPDLSGQTMTFELRYSLRR